jgi:hypothetical protein
MPGLTEQTDDETWYYQALAEDRIDNNADGDVWCTRCHAMLADFDQRYCDIRTAFEEHTCVEA